MQSYNEVLAALLSSDQQTTAALSFDLRDGLPAIADFESCCNRASDLLNGRGEPDMEASQLREWEREDDYGFDQLAAFMGKLMAGEPVPVSLYNPGDGCYPRCLLFSVLIEPDGALSMTVHIHRAEAVDELPGDVVTFGLLLLMFAAATERQVRRLTLFVDRLTLADANRFKATIKNRSAAPLVQLIATAPAGGLLDFTFSDFRLAELAAV